MKKRKIKLAIAYMISILPTSYLRVFFYRYIFKYDIQKSTIGWGTIIVVEDVKMYECFIGKNNKFKGPMKITMHKGARIGYENIFNCGWWTLEKKFISANYKKSLEIGKNTHISNRHYFDIVDSFILGDSSRIAGLASQFWTHGAGTIDRAINIGKHCYIGSAVRFSPGSSINNNTIVALGSVVTRKFDTPNIAIGGQPAKILKENYDWKSRIVC